ncbi:hypothetical protein [Halorubrum sp. DTA98]
MAVEHDEEPDGVVLGNGDTLSERVSEIDLEEEETCSTDEMRDLLDL